MKNLEKFLGKTKYEYLINFENMLDRYHIYSFYNWFDGEVFLGPEIEKYKVKISLKYEYDKMPDPYGALRLKDLGVKVTYNLKNEEDLELALNVAKIKSGPMSVNTEESVEDLPTKKVWIIDLEIPRKILDLFFNTEVTK
ncbi:MAG: hypothetical protein NZZ41_00935 [Candidatus Dojkabacteria bacterium]|nr:hypothetical protein [Candidatus Dojkabacteria bacterium]